MPSNPINPNIETSTDPVAMVDRYLIEAIGRGASDLHFEPFSDGVSVRVRLDGLLHTIGSIAKPLSDNVLCR